MRDNNVDRIGGGVFLAGLLVLFSTGYWWPGLLFLGGTVSLTRGVFGGRRREISGGLWAIGFGLLFALNLWSYWWLIFVLMAFGGLFGWNRWYNERDEDDHDHESEVDVPDKRKNEVLTYGDEELEIIEDKPKRGEARS